MKSPSGILVLVITSSFFSADPCLSNPVDERAEYAGPYVHGSQGDPSRRKGRLPAHGPDAFGVVLFVMRKKALKAGYMEKGIITIRRSADKGGALFSGPVSPEASLMRLGG
jgi:hypothetical protein